MTHPTPLLPGRRCPRLVCALLTPVIPDKPPHAAVAGARPAALSLGGLSCTMAVLSAFAIPSHPIPSSITNSNQHSNTCVFLLLHSLRLHLPPFIPASRLLIFSSFPKIFLLGWNDRSCIRTIITITLDLYCRLSSLLLCFGSTLLGLSCPLYEYLIRLLGSFSSLAAWIGRRFARDQAIVGYLEHKIFVLVVCASRNTSSSRLTSPHNFLPPRSYARVNSFGSIRLYPSIF